MPFVNCIEQPAHVSDGCYDGESNKIIHVAFIKKGNAVIWTDATTIETSINTLVTQSNAVIVRNISGSKSAASTKEGKGAGRAVKRILGKEHSITYVDLQYVDNILFYNALEVNSTNYYLVYWTSNYAWRTDVNAPLFVKADDIITDDVTTSIEAVINVSWSQKGNPIAIASPSSHFDVLP